MGVQQSKEKMLYESVRMGDIGMIRHLRSEGASLNWTNISEKTPLILACSAANRLPVVKALLDLGADVNYYNPGNHVGTALQRASRRGLEQIVLLLLSHGANPLLRDLHGRNALDCARQGGHTGTVRAIENKISFFSGWLRKFQSYAVTYNGFAPTPRRVWAVVLPSDPALSMNVNTLKIALYPDRQSPRPFKVVRLKKFSPLPPDFGSADPELVFSIKGSEKQFGLRSGEVGDIEQLKLLYNTCRGLFEPKDPSSAAATRTAPPRWPPGIGPATLTMSASAPPASQEEEEIALAITASIQSAVQEGILLPAISFNRPGDADGCEIVSYPSVDSPSVTGLSAPIVMDRMSEGEGTSGTTCCVICVDAPAQAACVPCGHLAGCEACLNEVKMKGFGCPVCRAGIERIMKIYAV